MATTIKTKETPTPVKRRGIRFQGMIEYIHSYFNFISKTQSECSELSVNDRFHVVRTREDGCDTHIFTGNKYTIVISIRQNES